MVIQKRKKKSNNFQLLYKERALDIQIRIDNLLQTYHYPLTFYENLTNAQIKAMHTRMLVEKIKSIKP